MYFLSNVYGSFHPTFPSPHPPSQCIYHDFSPLARLLHAVYVKVRKIFSAQADMFAKLHEQSFIRRDKKLVCNASLIFRFPPSYSLFIPFPRILDSSSCIFCIPSSWIFSFFLICPQYVFSLMHQSLLLPHWFSFLHYVS